MTSPTTAPSAADAAATAKGDLSSLNRSLGTALEVLDAERSVKPSPVAESSHQSKAAATEKVKSALDSNDDAMETTTSTPEPVGSSGSIAKKESPAPSSATSVATTTTTASTKPAPKKAHEKKWRWKKPKGRPKRPLSAYNLFFQEQRKALRQNREAFDRAQREALGESHDSKAQLGFAGLAKYIAGKWKEMKPEDREMYERAATIEKSKYYDALEVWKKENEGKDEALKATSTKSSSMSSSSTGSGVSPVDIEALKVATLQQQSSLLVTQMMLQRQAAMTMAAANQSSYGSGMSTMMPPMQSHGMPSSMASSSMRGASCDTNRGMSPLDMHYAVHGGRSMSMPMGYLPTTDQNPDARTTVSMTRRSSSMPMVSNPSDNTMVPSSNQSYSTGDHYSTDCNEYWEDDQPSEMRAQMGHTSSRRLSMPSMTTNSRPAPFSASGGIKPSPISVSRRSQSMPMVNTEYVEAMAHDGNGPYDHPPVAINTDNSNHSSYSTGMHSSSHQRQQGPGDFELLPASDGQQQMQPHSPMGQRTLSNMGGGSRRMSMPGSMPSQQQQQQRPRQVMPSARMARNRGHRSQSMPMANTEYVDARTQQQQYGYQQQQKQQGHDDHEPLDMDQGLELDAIEKDWENDPNASHPHSRGVRGAPVSHRRMSMPSSSLRSGNSNWSSSRPPTGRRTNIPVVNQSNYIVLDGADEDEPRRQQQQQPHDASATPDEPVPLHHNSGAGDPMDMEDEYNDLLTSLRSHD